MSSAMKVIIGVVGFGMLLLVARGIYVDRKEHARLPPATVANGR